MSFWLWKGASSARALVDSALAGSQDDAWLSWTSVSLPASGPAAATTMTQKASTSHFVTRPVSFPAICLCMDPVNRMGPTVVIGVYPEIAGGLPNRDLRRYLRSARSPGRPSRP